MTHRRSQLAVLATFLSVGFGALAVHAQADDINEDLTLNIDQKRITESPFERSMRVSLDLTRLQLAVGAGAAADRADITLAGVRGVVRFRASLADVRARLARLTGPR